MSFFLTTLTIAVLVLKDWTCAWGGPSIEHRHRMALFAAYYIEIAGSTRGLFGGDDCNSPLELAFAFANRSWILRGVLIATVCVQGADKTAQGVTLNRGCKLGHERSADRVVHWVSREKDGERGEWKKKRKKERKERTSRVTRKKTGKRNGCLVCYRFYHIYLFMLY